MCCGGGGRGTVAAALEKLLAMSGRASTSQGCGGKRALLSGRGCSCVSRATRIASRGAFWVTGRVGLCRAAPHCQGRAALWHSRRRSCSAL
jgi:hypothetical protein